MQLRFVVNGEEVVVEVASTVLLHKARDLALHATDNTGRPSADWEVRSELGELLDLDQPVEVYRAGTWLFVTLRVGIGGSVDVPHP